METNDTKNFILKQTFLLLLTKGYDAVSITDIQKATAMSRGLLYHYFGNKEELFLAVAEKYLIGLLEVDAVAVEGLDIPQLIAHMVDKYRLAMQTAWGDYQGTSKISIANYDFLIFRFTQQYKTMSERFALMRERETRIWMNAIEISKREGAINKETDAAKMAEYFVCLLDGIWMNAVNKGDSSKLINDFEMMLSGFYELLKR
ncbi:MAG: TetR/AcrR family transcriptional regulator [Tannerellaceae bacterium]